MISPLPRFRFGVARRVGAGELEVAVADRAPRRGAAGRASRPSCPPRDIARDNAVTCHELPCHGP